MKKVLLVLYITSLVCCFLTGCNKTNNSETTTKETASEESSTANSNISQNTDDTDTANISYTDDDMFTERDRRTDYSEKDSILIELNGNTATSTSNSVLISDSTITITEEATYIITGTLDNGMIIIDAEDTAKLQLVFDNVSITNHTCAPLYILEADKVFITLAKDTTNSLTNGGTFTSLDENNIDGVIFSKQDLTFNGSGNLTINSPAGHGIVCKDDLVFTGGTYIINSASHGLDTNDSVRITDETSLTITAGKAGIHCENADDTSLGFIYISNGIFTIDSDADSIHSDASITVNGGDFEITSGDDGFHADDALTITNGNINITEAYEGLEALNIDISGGNINIHSSDDGLNAAGGVDASGTNTSGDNDFVTNPEINGGPHGSMGGPHGGMNTPPGEMGGMSSNSNGSIKISGGTLYINASGDGIDANGTLEITGGTTTITGPTHGDTATLDYDVSGTITGGTFIGTGASNMAQTFSESAQGVIAVDFGNQSAGTTITLNDKNGNTIISYTPVLDYSVVILSSPDIVSGEPYTIIVGNNSWDFEAY